MRELTDTELEVVSGGATAIEYGLIAAGFSLTTVTAVRKALGDAVALSNNLTAVTAVSDATGSTG